MGKMLSKGFLVAAQNTSTVDYVKQAYALALSIKATQKEVNTISIMTNDIVPENYKSVFDKIIPIPWIDESRQTDWKIENRWKLYHISPYDETIVLDTDMLLLEDVSLWWKHCSNYELLFCSRVKNYKNEIILKDKFHRSAFIENNLSNPYFGLHYFKKNDFAHSFYKILEFIVYNWEWFWTKFASEHYQNWLSMDLASAIAIDMLDCHSQVLDSAGPLEFVHMKPGIQNWTDTSQRWTDMVPYYINDKGAVFVANIKQSKLFHYVEKDFVDQNVLKIFENLN
jgi:hypothetical protein